MTEQEIREDEKAREQHRSDWIEAEYETMGWGQEKIQEEYHEDPFFNGHKAVWVQVWTSDGTSEVEAPEGTPVTCAICGKIKEEL